MTDMYTREVLTTRIDLIRTHFTFEPAYTLPNNQYNDQILDKEYGVYLKRSIFCKSQFVRRYEMH